MVTTILPLRLSGAAVRRGAARLVGPIDLTMAGTGVTVIMGPNGSGKTMLLRLMHGLEPAREGRVEWARPVEEARRRQAFVFQAPIMMRRSVVDCIAYPLRLRGLGRRAARARAEAAARAAGLDHALDLPAPSLSGGERQKLALARALITRPEVLFLDEPCASLDGRSMREIEATLRAARDGGARIVMSTHDIGQARRLADEIVFLHRGALCEAGPAAAFFDEPRSEAARDYLAGRIPE